MKGTVLVTGGAGFIGSAVINELKAQGVKICVLDNLSFGRREHAAVEDDAFFNVDILDASAVMQTVKEVAPTWVIHLAAIHFIPYCNAHPYESSDINLRGTINVLDAASAVSSVKKVFFASTAAVYADSATPISEKSSLVAPLDIYGLSKYTGERLVSEFHLATDVPCVIGRLFNAYGPRETNPHLIPEIHRQIQEGVTDIQLGNILTYRDYIHTSDLARAIYLLMARESKGIDIFNIGSGSSLTAQDVVEHFERATGRKLHITVASDRVRKVDRQLLQADITKIRTAIDWKPEMLFDKGIAALVHGDS